LTKSPPPKIKESEYFRAPAIMHNRGMYFLANDKVIDQAVTFLNSVRAHNPEIPLCLIPYDRKIERVRALAQRYNFLTIEDESLLSWCDSISLEFHESTCRGRGMYRKLAAWFGPFEEFLYIDLDAVVLRSVDVVFPLLREFDVITSYSNDPHGRKFVWLDSIKPNGYISQEEIDYSANMGSILSSRGLLTRSLVDSLVPGAKALSPHMELRCFDQPFNNYVVVKSTKRYTSLRRLNQRSAGRPWPEECWPGDDKWRIALDGKATYNGEPRELLHIHWSGVMAPHRWEKRLYSILDKWGISVPSVRFNLKQGHIWRHYRYLKAA
jgi:hypothetical protein